MYCIYFLSKIERWLGKERNFEMHWKFQEIGFHLKGDVSDKHANNTFVYRKLPSAYERDNFDLSIAVSDE